MSEDIKIGPTPTRTPERGGSLGRKFVASLASLALLAGCSSGEVVNAVPEKTTISTPGNNSEKPSPTPAQETTTPKPELPFDPAVVEVMKNSSVKEFEGFSEELRIGYALAAYYYEANVESHHASDISQITLGGKLLYKYNPHGAISTDEQSDGQTIMDSLTYRTAFAMIQEDPEEVKKLISGVVRMGNPSSEIYKEYVKYYSDRAGARLSQDSVSGDLYNVQKTDTEWVTNPITGEKELLARMFTKGLVVEAVYVPRSGISENNRDFDDDGEKKGVWLMVSEREVDVTVG